VAERRRGADLLNLSGPLPSRRPTCARREFFLRVFDPEALRTPSSSVRSEPKSVDFEKVQATLIDPALAKLGFKGDTTAVIARAGSIRSDMFQLLLTADLVIG
jgi:hypothetical protein